MCSQSPEWATLILQTTLRHQLQQRWRGLQQRRRLQAISTLDSPQQQVKINFYLFLKLFFPFNKTHFLSILFTVLWLVHLFLSFFFYPQQPKPILVLMICYWCNNKYRITNSCSYWGGNIHTHDFSHLPAKYNYWQAFVLFHNPQSHNTVYQ